MLYIIFNPCTHMAYCRKRYPITIDQFISMLRCRIYEYQNNIKDVGQEWRDIIDNGGLEQIRICVDKDPNAERPWPYRTFHSYKYNYDLKIYLDNHPKMKVYPITSFREYNDEMKRYKQLYWTRKL